MHLFRYSALSARSAVYVDGQRVLDALTEAKLAGLRSSHWETEEGLPCVVSSDGQSITFFDDYFRYLRSDGVSLGSIKSYAQDLIVFARYLDQVKSKDLLSASSSDVASYRALRLEGPHDFRLKGTSWRRVSASLTRFYMWAADEEVRLIARAPKTWFRRDGVRADSTVRYIPIDRYIEFRSHLLSSAIRNGLRNAAFAELLVTSGLRVQEANSLLECELVPNSLDTWPGRLRLLHLPEAITKGRKPRQVPLSRRYVETHLAAYLREERSFAIERWRRSGGVHALQDALVGILQQNKKLLIRGAEKAVALERLSIPERRRLVLLPHANAPLSTAAPASLWLNTDGSPCSVRAWSSIFRRASSALGGAPISPHTLRHTFAVAWLTRLVRVQLSRGGSIERADDRTREMYLKVALDPLRIIQRWLGHSSYLTTQKYLSYVDEVVELIELAAELSDEELAIHLGVKI